LSATKAEKGPRAVNEAWCATEEKQLTDEFVEGRYRVVYNKFKEERCTVLVKQLSYFQVS
jgi:hypothetical protein